MFLMKVWRKKTLEKTRKIQKYSYIFTRKTSKKQCRMSLLINNKQNHPWWMKHVYIIKLYFLLISCSKKVCQFFFVFQYFFLYLFFQMISTWPQIILIMEITATASGYSKSTVHRQLVHRHLQHQRWLRQHWGT